MWPYHSHIWNDCSTVYFKSGGCLKNKNKNGIFFYYHAKYTFYENQQDINYLYIYNGHKHLSKSNSIMSLVNLLDYIKCLRMNCDGWLMPNYQGSELSAGIWQSLTNDAKQIISHAWVLHWLIYTWLNAPCHSQNKQSTSHELITL